jgi:hypothetical protein
MNPTHVLPFTHLPIDPRKHRDLRKVCGPYHFRQDADSEYRSFYLDSDFAPGLRWRYADEITRIDHNGWYVDDFEQDTYRGIVLALPKSRGFLAGYTMEEGMISLVNVKWIHDEEVDAARAADSEAEFAAEESRRNQEIEVVPVVPVASDGNWTIGYRDGEPGEWSGNMTTYTTESEWMSHREGDTWCDGNEEWTVNEDDVWQDAEGQTY